jgi:hypothetical protein
MKGEMFWNTELSTAHYTMYLSTASTAPDTTYRAIAVGETHNSLLVPLLSRQLL